MSLRVHNSLTRAKERFVPRTAGRVGMYVCGVTPYDTAHIGHARSAIVFDVIRRYLEYRYPDHRVTFVKNYTDVDDKIIARARESGVDWRALTAQHIAEYEQDMARLGVTPPTEAPRATGHIPEMLDLVGRLVAQGFAYAVDGDVYFEVGRFPAYGRLSGRNLDELLAGARVEVDARKRDPRDFALWKSAKPGEPSWPSPWGPGRPGWHIECSAMSMKFLGPTFDVHGGGVDLLFPHHECELAQSEAATGQPFARYWVHNGFVNLGAEKMSKSLGNVLSIRELLGRHDGEAIRLYLLQTHYRNPIDFGEERIAEAARALDRFRDLFDAAGRLAPLEASGPDGDGGLGVEVARARERFEAAMDDDFHTPQAIAALQDLRSALNGYHGLVESGQRPPRPFREGVDALWELAGVLGFQARGHELVRSGADADPFAASVQRLVEERDDARRRRDWGRADAIRTQLEAQGITLEDTPAGTRWKRRVVRNDR